jgi:hypothetical protein
LQDTIDPRQKDQTHTGLITASDVWKLTAKQQVLLSGFFRTYNLALYSNFGNGLIRQSEFRTVTGGNATYTNKVAEFLTVLAGMDYQHDAPRRLDLDHFMSNDPAVYGPFQKVTANNVTIWDVAPFVALDGSLTRHLRYYAGFRRDEIGFDNVDLLIPLHSSSPGSQPSAFLSVTFSRSANFGRLTFGSMPKGAFSSCVHLSWIQ